MGAVSRGQFTKRTGSSIATGITAGATALLFEWIVYQLGRTNIDSIQLKNLMILGTERKDTEVYPCLLYTSGKAYYQDAKEIMSNHEYDRLYDELLVLEQELGITMAKDVYKRQT